MRTKPTEEQKNPQTLTAPVVLLRKNSRDRPIPVVLETARRMVELGYAYVINSAAIGALSEDGYYSK